MIFPGAVTQSGARIFTGQSSLTPADSDAIKAECPSVAYASPGERTAGQGGAGELNWGTQIQGVGVDWPFIRAWNLESGAWFGESDIKGAAKVCVLGRTVSDNLFPSGGAVGQVVRIKNVPFKVIGVLGAKGQSSWGQDQDDVIMIPFSTAERRVMGSAILGSVEMIYASAGRAADVPAAAEGITNALRQQHRIARGQDDDFTVRTLEDIAGASAAASQVMGNLLLAAVDRGSRGPGAARRGSEGRGRAREGLRPGSPARSPGGLPRRAAVPMTVRSHGAARSAPGGGARDERAFHRGSRGRTSSSNASAACCASPSPIPPAR